MRSERDACLTAQLSSLSLTRRGLLKRAGWAAAAAVCSNAATFAAEDVSPVMTALTAYMSDARNHALPDKVLEETKHHALDTVAAMVSGSELPPGRKAIQFARSYGGEKIATVVASNVICGPIEAAVANGVLAHSDETDDDYTGGGAHPGAAVIPASLALGEQFDISGAHFLRAVALGYDIGMRAMKALGSDMVLRDTHNLIGTFGAAAAGGCIAGLTPQQMRWLIDYASQQAGEPVAFQA